MREVICADASEILKSEKEFDSIVTSLPDREETGMQFDEWQAWFTEMVRLIVSKVKNYAIFYQTDRKVDGHIIDKSFLVNYGIMSGGGHTIFHKVCLRRDPGKIDLFRPTFTHLICASRNLKSGKATLDVIHRGKTIYPNAMGYEACDLALRFIRDNSDTKKIVDPFCGRGSVLLFAEKYGFETFGIEIDPAQCEYARTLKS